MTYIMRPHAIHIPPSMILVTIANLAVRSSAASCYTIIELLHTITIVTAIAITTKAKQFSAGTIIATSRPANRCDNLSRIGSNSNSGIRSSISGIVSCYSDSGIRSCIISREIKSRAKIRIHLRCLCRLCSARELSIATTNEEKHCSEHRVGLVHGIYVAACVVNGSALVSFSSWTRHELCSLQSLCHIIKKKWGKLPRPILISRSFPIGVYLSSLH